MGIVLRIMEIKIKGEELPPIGNVKMNNYVETSVERNNNLMTQRTTVNDFVVC